MYNELTYDIISDLFLEGYISLSELSYYISPRIKDVINKTPVVSKREFIDSVQKGDIIVAYAAKNKFLQTRKAKILLKLIATFQGSPYSTSKMVLSDSMIAGYGAKKIEKPEDNVVAQVSIKSFMGIRNEMMLIRIPELTDTQKNKAVNFIKKRFGQPYTSIDLLKTSWNRLLNRRFFAFLKDRPIEPIEVRLIQNPLFCSNLISLALISAGFKKQFNNKHPWDTWPRDFILADFTEKICRIEPK